MRCPGETTGEVLLVNGANGAVGSAGAQLGLAAGARVVANVRSPDSAHALAQAGALIGVPGATFLNDVGGGAQIDGGDAAQPLHARRPLRSRTTPTAS